MGRNSSKMHKKVIDTDIEVVPKKKNNKKITRDLNNNITKDLSEKNNVNNNKKTETVDNIPIKKKRILRKKYRLCLTILVGFMIIFSVILTCKFIMTNKHERELQLLLKKQEIITDEIKSHYGNYVKILKNTKLYRRDEQNNFYEYGIIYAGQQTILLEQEIDHSTKYFYSSELDAYLEYHFLEPIESLMEYNKRYQNYLPFNQNVVTNDEFSLYDNGEKVYSFHQSMTFPIIINNDDGKYYVEYNKRLLYLINDDIKEFVKTENNKIKNASKVTTLCYHRIYDTNEKCNDLYICKSKSNFEKEMKYLADNKFLTLTMQEMYWYLSKKIQIPQKSVLITFDDGYLFANGIEILEKYGLYGTGFIKTASFDDLSQFDSPNFELQSHTDKLHVSYTCPRENDSQQGGGILCLPEKTILDDLHVSREKLNGAIALAYPFYDYNNRAIKLVEKSGFKLAFVGANGVGGRSWPGINLYKVPRMTIWNTTTIQEFKNYVNN